ncbi:MAG: hypothetical protein ACHQ01_01620 [Candidatus Limnocylindrales bacterium]
MGSALRRGFVAAAIAAVVVVAAVGVAGAASPAPVAGGPAGSGVCAAPAGAARSNSTVVTLRAFANCEIGRRLTTLDQLSAAAAASTGLTASDASALTADIDADRSGLAALRAAIDGQRSLAALKLEIAQVVTRFRVYDLLGPQVALTIGADDVLSLQTHFDGISTTLVGRIAAAQAAGKDVAAAQAALDAMNGSVGDAVALASPLPGQLLALTPGQFSAGSASAVLTTARAHLLGARDDVKAATQAARNVLADLK